MALFCLMEILSLDDNIRRRGFVVLVDDQCSTRENYPRHFQRHGRFSDEIFPIRLRTYHFCHASKALCYIIWPACKFFLPRHVRIRGYFIMARRPMFSVVFVPTASFLTVSPPSSGATSPWTRANSCTRGWPPRQLCLAFTFRQLLPTSANMDPDQQQILFTHQDVLPRRQRRWWWQRLLETHKIRCMATIKPVPKTSPPVATLRPLFLRLPKELGVAAVGRRDSDSGSGGPLRRRRKVWSTHGWPRPSRPSRPIQK